MYHNQIGEMYHVITPVFDLTHQGLITMNLVLGLFFQFVGLRYPPHFDFGKKNSDTPDVDRDL